MKIPLCNIEVLVEHMAGIVGGQLLAEKGMRFMGFYQFEVACGTFVCCLLDGQSVYFEAEKVRILGSDS